MSLTEGLVALLARPVRDADRARAALHVLDWIGCAAAGAAGEAGARLPRICRVWKRDRRASCSAAAPRARMAALANGAFGNVLEMDDVHREAILHAGPVVVPAALALAAARDRARGRRCSMPCCAATRPRSGSAARSAPRTTRRFHPSATCGPFGAAAAARRCSGSMPRACADALGNAGSIAGGLWRCRHEPG